MFSLGKPVKCVHTKDKLFNWKVAPNTQQSVCIPFTSSSTSSSAPSELRAETSTPPSSPSTSRSRSPRSRTRGQSRSPPRTPRGRAPRIQSLSPLRNTPPPAGSPRDSRRDTPTRNTRLLQGRLQYVCRNDGCGQSFRSYRDRNDHETSTCRNMPQSQV